MFETYGTYHSTIEINHSPFFDSMAFYPTRDGGQVGVGDVGANGRRLLLEVGALAPYGRSSYQVMDAKSGAIAATGYAEFHETANEADFAGYWWEGAPWFQAAPNRGAWYLMRICDDV